MTYYIDFDNTLFDTVSFYNDLKSIIKKHGIDEEIIKKYHIENNGIYSPLKLIDYCIEKKIVDNKILEDVNLHFENTGKYLYEDAKRFLERIKPNNRLVLLTYGDYEYQQRKIMPCSIDEYFDEIMITDKEKYTLDLDFKNGIFIDDNCNVIKDLLSKEPYRIIRIKRLNNPRSKHILNNDLVDEYENLTSINL